jgi:hypothetical protein
MTEKLSFEDKIQGLIAYHHTLEEVDPNLDNHSEVANPNLFYGRSGSGVRVPLLDARESVRDSIKCHARAQYEWNDGYPGSRHFESKDLRRDTDEERAERADILAMMTAPLTPELRKERADHIAGILAAIVSGKTITLTKYNTFRREYDVPQEFTVDAGRALFGVFRNSHITSRVLNVQYDTPVDWPKEETGESVIALDIESILRDGDKVEPAAVVA